MFTSQTKKIGVIAAAMLLLSAVLLSMSYLGIVHADSNPIFLTRNNSVISTYPSNGAFSVGTSTPSGTPQTQIAKLSVTLGVTDTWTKAFSVASTTGTGTATTTKDLLSIYRTGCIQTVATSTATPIKLVFGTVPTTTVSGFVEWQYGTCP